MTLTITGGSEDGRLALRLNATDSSVVEVDDFDDGHIDFSFNRAEFNLIVVNAGSGNDVVRIDDVSGTFTDVHPTTLNGQEGNDSLSGGGGAETLNGGPGNDTLNGNDGNDLLAGGDDDDVLTGGRGTDQSHGEAGNDRMVWNPGDGSDVNEGGPGTDIVEVNGGNGNELFSVAANATRVRFDRIDPAPFALDIITAERLELNAHGGNDSLLCTGNLAALIQVRANGGPGNDTLLGSNGADELIGGDDDDFIDGQQGSDIVQMGAGNDVFQWDPGDGSDIVEGQDGQDTMVFNGSGGNEEFIAGANGSRARFTRNLGNIVMDLDGVEQIDVHAAGGGDSVVVNDLAGTSTVQLNVSLAATIGGTTGDAAADSLVVNGVAGNDSMAISGTATSASVIMPTMQLNITQCEVANDFLTVNGLAGNDVISATALAGGVIQLLLNGGDDNDTVNGSSGSDILIGGDGDDTLSGEPGLDTAFLGSGNDTFQWDPGDASDIVEGQAGTDQLLFFGSNANENIQILANGGRALLLRDVAAITMDMNDMEIIEYRARGGSDTSSIADMTGTDVTLVRIDLDATAGGGDSAPDTVIVNASQGADVFGAADAVDGVSVFGLATAVEVVNAEPASDRLQLNGLGGDDVINTASVSADLIQLTQSGGLGGDVMFGGPAVETMIGGDGDDVALMGAGNDTFTWNPGDDNDTLEGQAGIDTMLFTGSGAAEQITLTANGGRVIFFRDVATVTMDLNDIERIDFNALGGVDRVVVNSLAGTDVTDVNIDLALSVGGNNGDAAGDTITVNGTPDPDAIDVAAVNGAVEVSGLSARVRIEHPEAIGDLLTVNGLAGTDSISVGGGVTALIMVQINQ